MDPIFASPVYKIFQTVVYFLIHACAAEGEITFEINNCIIYGGYFQRVLNSIFARTQ